MSPAWAPLSASHSNQDARASGARPRSHRGGRRGCDCGSLPRSTGFGKAALAGLVILRKIFSFSSFKRGTHAAYCHCGSWAGGLPLAPSARPVSAAPAPELSRHLAAPLQRGSAAVTWHPSRALLLAFCPGLQHFHVFLMSFQDVAESQQLLLLPGVPAVFLHGV